MSKRRFGPVLVLAVAFLVAGGAVAQDFQFDTRIAQERAAADALNHAIASLQTDIARLRGAQAAYFGAGQSPEFWQTRASEIAAGIEQTISSLQASAVPAAVGHYDAALSALGGLNSLDQKVRDDLEAGATRLAAEAVFSDANASTQTLSAELAGAQREEAAAGSAREAELRRQRFILEAGAMGALLVALVVFALRQPKAAPAETSIPATSERIVPRIVAQAAPAAKAEAPASRVDWPAAAQVCVDLGRVLDGRDIPPLLERAARVLEARGLVLWVSDTAGALLRPSLAHGYPDKVLQRMGTLQVDADNVTSLAFRSMQPQTLKGAGGTTNAFAVPLVTSSGCIGVLAAEVGKGNPESLAAARMFAAQLATLVAPSASGLEQAAEA